MEHFFHSPIKDSPYGQAVPISMFGESFVRANDPPYENLFALDANCPPPDLSLFDQVSAFSADQSGPLQDINQYISSPVRSYSELDADDFKTPPEGERVVRADERDSEAEIERSVEDDYERDVESNAEKGSKTDESELEKNIERNIQRDIEKNVDRHADRNIERTVQRASAKKIERNIERDIEKNAPRNVEKNCERGVEKAIAKDDQSGVPRETEIGPRPEAMKRRRPNLSEDVQTFLKQECERRVLNIIKKENSNLRAAHAHNMKVVAAEIAKLKLDLSEAEDEFKQEEHHFLERKSSYQSQLDTSSQYDITFEKEKSESFTQFVDQVGLEKNKLTQQFFQTQDEMDQKVDQFYAGITDPIEELKATLSSIHKSLDDLQLEGDKLSETIADSQSRSNQNIQLINQRNELRQTEKQLLEQIIENHRERLEETLQKTSSEREQLEKSEQDNENIQVEVDSLIRSKEVDSNSNITLLESRDEITAENKEKISRQALEYESIQNLYREFGSSIPIKSKRVLDFQDLKEMAKDLSYELKNRTYQFEQSKWKMEQREEQVERLKERLSDINEQTDLMDSELEEMNASKLDDLSQGSDDSISVIP